MKTKLESNRPVALAICLALAALLIPAVAAAQTQTGALAFESEGLDLETGTVINLFDLAADPGAVDFHVAYNAHRATRAVVFQAVGAEIALMVDTPFEYVYASDVAVLTFTAGLVDESCDGGDTVVLRTAGGSVYKVGNLSEDAAAGLVVFDYELLEGPQAAIPQSRPGSSVLASAVRGTQPSRLPDDRKLPAAGARDAVPAAAWAAIEEAIERDRYSADAILATTGEGPVLSAANPAQGYTTRFSGGGIRLRSAGSGLEMGLSLVGYGYQGRMLQPVVGEPEAKGQRVETVRGPITEWYVNRPGGLEQGFTLAAAPGETPGEGPLRLEMRLSGPLVAEQLDDAIVLRDSDGRSRLRYAGLKAWDATGRELAAEMVLAGNRLTLEVDDSGVTYPVTIDPTIVNSDAKLVASDATDRNACCNRTNLFGQASAISGDTIVVGASQMSDASSALEPGAAYVFVKPAGGWSATLTESAKLVASNPADFDRIAHNLDIDGDTVVLTCRTCDRLGTNSAVVYLYQRPPTGWSGTLTETAELSRAGASDNVVFGQSVAVSGDTVVVGAPNAILPGFGSRQGAAYTFVKPASGWSGALTETAILAHSTPTDRRLGQAVDVEGSIVAAGAFNESGRRGAAYVYLEPAGGWSGTLTENARLLASDAASNDSLAASSLAISGDVIVSAAPRAFGRRGAGYLFEKPAGGWSGTLFESAKLVGSDTVFVDSLGGGADGGSQIGFECDTVYLGSRFHVATAGAPNRSRGAIYRFDKPVGGWSGLLFETDKLLASDGELFDALGWSVDVSGGVVVGGALYGDNDPLSINDTGSAYVWEGASSCAATCSDGDGDGYGSPGDASCPNGAADDCNDGDSAINPGATELCDGVDDDCSGVADDNIPTTPTTCGVGECAGNTGSESCVGGVLVDDCDPLAGASLDDQCDGLDNDCDGVADDNYVASITTCGVGECAGNEGLLTCVGGSTVDTCDPLAGATAEVCDRLDNDCDGTDDEDTPDGDVDGVCDDIDNCPADANPGQENCDGDATGDACDSDDTDLDGLTDAQEISFAGICPSGCPNPVDPDSDDDGVLDGFESDPANVDKNCDFCDADTDDDGVDDFADPFCNNAALTGACAQDLGAFEEYVLQIDLGEFQAPGANTVQQRRQTRSNLAGIIGKAAKHMAKSNSCPSNRTANAVGELQKARDRVDGAEPPLDDMVSGAEKQFVLDTIDLFIQAITACVC